MAIRIRLSDGTEMLVQATLDEFKKALQVATSTGQVLEIKQPDGNVIAVTAQAVEILQEDPAAAQGLSERFAAAAAR